MKIDENQEGNRIKTQLKNNLQDYRHLFSTRNNAYQIALGCTGIWKSYCLIVKNDLYTNKIAGNLSPE